MILIEGCNINTSDTSLLYIPANTDVTSKAILKELQQGCTLEITDCNSCHGYYSASKYAPHNGKAF
jgi:hypothetical protein